MMKQLLLLLFGILSMVNVSHAIPNDVNGDNLVNISDVIATINMVLNPNTATAAADCNAPTGVDIADVICIINRVLGNTISREDAARFLNQATFGATLDDINALTSSNYETWINQQFNLPAPAFFVDDLAANWLNTCRRDGDNGMGNLYTSIDQFVDTWVPEELSSAAWWDAVLNNNDQLRQRVTFALSEILVVSGRGPLSDSDFGLADYYDLLYTNAFGNYRDLLEKVTLHPIMGRYLSMVKNEKANPAENIRPDENYAREILQLFSVGVHDLNLDGTLKNGQPTPTYNQDVIEGFARIFTGWNFANSKSANPADNDWDLWIDDGDTRTPMIPWQEYHDSANTKQLLSLNGSPTILPAGGTAEADLTAALDNIFAHDNIAPFVSKQLIQRLVTSNPTPAYVARVAQKFNNNGAGVKGDLKAVVKAILLDTEARNGHATIANFGKLREPLLRLSHLRRVFGTDAIVKSGTFWEQVSCGQGSYRFYPMPIGSTLSAIGQELLESPSVFNFFRPNYSPAGVLRDASLVAPEFQIVTENTMTQLANEIEKEIVGRDWNDYPNDYITVDTTREITLASNIDALLNHLNLLLLNGNMPSDLRTLIRDYLNSAPYYDNSDKQSFQARDAIMLILHSPDYLIQK